MKQVFISSLIFAMIANVPFTVADIIVKIQNGRRLESASYFIDSFESSAVIMFFISLIGGFLGMALVAAFSSTAKISRIQKSMLYAAVTYATIIGIKYLLLGFRNPHIISSTSELLCVIVSYYISYIFLNKKRVSAT